MPTCREEVDLVRLLDRCKRLAQDSKFEDWKLARFVRTLGASLKKLESEHHHEISEELLAQYRRDITFLDGIVAAAQKRSLESASAAAAKLVVPSTTVSDSVHFSVGTGLSEEPSPVSLASLKATTVGRYKSDLRRLLLGDDANAGLSGLRRRPASDTKLSPDIDDVVRHHDEMQRELADEFLRMTQQLKSNVASAGDIVRGDTAVVERASAAASKNDADLRREAERLSKLVASWWDAFVWLLLLAVSLSFIAMVLFMRLFPKPT